MLGITGPGNGLQLHLRAGPGKAAGTDGQAAAPPVGLSADRPTEPMFDHSIHDGTDGLQLQATLRGPALRSGAALGAAGLRSLILSTRSTSLRDQLAHPFDQTLRPAAGGHRGS